MPEPQTGTEQSPEEPLVIDSMVGVRTGTPSVTLTWGDRRTYLNPTKAREFALEMLKEATYCELDATLFNWAQEKAGQDKKEAAKLVALFRARRRGELPSCTLNLHGQSIRPATARKMARFLNEAASMTEGEAYLIDLLIQEIGLDANVASYLVMEFRKMRGAITLPGADESLPTTERLAVAMEAAGCPEEMIQRARTGYYDDFKSELATPLIVLVNDLREIGQEELVERVIDGEFDGTPEESAAWFEAEGKNLLPESMWGMFGGKPKKRKPKGFGGKS